MEVIDFNMPLLERGRLYKPEEVQNCICVDNEGSSDYNLMLGHFPRSLDQVFDFDFKQYRRDEPVFLQYHVLPLAEFAEQIQRNQEMFDQLDALRKQGKVLRRPEMDRDRIQQISEKLQYGDVIYPVFIQKNDPQRRIIEGMHRVIAIRQLGGWQFPAYLVGYREWF